MAGQVVLGEVDPVLDTLFRFVEHLVQAASPASQHFPHWASPAMLAPFPVGRGMPSVGLLVVPCHFASLVVCGQLGLPGLEVLDLQPEPAVLLVCRCFHLLSLIHI